MQSVDRSRLTWPIIGHAPQVDRLQRMVERGNFPPALLITGVPGVGRLTLAKSFAAAVMCPDAKAATGCGICPTCKHIAAGIHPDMAIWDVKRQEVESGVSRSGAMTIETVRAISASTALRPREADRRFVVINDAETLGYPAQQALLKTLEDAPSFVVMILITTSSSALLETVQSRCVEIPLQLVPTAEIAAALNSPDAERIARLAAGRPGWALSAVATSEIVEKEEAKVTAIEAWIRMPRRDRLIEAYIRGDRFLRDRARVIDDLAAARIAWRDILLSTINVSQYSVDPTRAGRLALQPTITPRQVLTALNATEQCYLDLVRNVRPRLAMQSMVNQWPILS